MLSHGAASRSRIVDAAIGCIKESGLSALTVSAVAAKASVSSALVHYHFTFKERLVAAAATGIARARGDSLTSALEVPGGLATLDSLWRSLERSARSGAERAWYDLVLRAAGDKEVRVQLAAYATRRARTLSARLPPLLAWLGSAASPGAEELATAVAAQLDGCALALVSGERPEIVRAAYDAFWLALIASGQSSDRR